MSERAAGWFNAVQGCTWRIVKLGTESAVWKVAWALRNRRGISIEGERQFSTSTKAGSVSTMASRILAIPFKRQVKPLIGFLTPRNRCHPGSTDETWTGRRDHLLVLFLYNTGARISEALALRVDDVLRTQAKEVELQGKGRKRRTLPLWRQTRRHLLRWDPREQIQLGYAPIPEPLWRVLESLRRLPTNPETGPPRVRQIDQPEATADFPAPVSACHRHVPAKNGDYS